MLLHTETKREKTELLLGFMTTNFPKEKIVNLQYCPPIIVPFISTVPW